MKTPNPDVDSFVEALRGDFPSAEDEARVRSRLLSAGVLVTSAAVTTSGAAASLSAATATSGVALSGAALGGTAAGGAALGAQVAGTAGAPLVLVKAGLVSKLLMLPVAAKVGVATSLALAVAATSAPLVSSRSEAPAVVAPSNDVAPSINAAPQSVAPSIEVRPPQSEAPVAQVAPSNDLPRVAPASAQPIQPRTEQTPSIPERREVVRRGSAAREPAPVERAPMERGRASSLAEETRLMEQAMLAVGAGEHELARRWLGEHSRRFPEGLLARERERAVARLPQAGDGNQTSSP